MNKIQDNDVVTKTSQYKFWKHKADFAEINRRNFQIRIKEYFSLSTKKVTYLSLLLALEILMTIFSKFVMGLIPVSGFFVIELSFFVILIILLMSNLFYAMLILQAAIWIRLALGSEPVGLIAMTLVDGSYLLIFACLLFICKFLIARFSNDLKGNQKKVLVLTIIIGIVSALFAAAIGLLINYAFILELYGIDKSAKAGFYPIIVSLTFVKFIINLVLYLLTYKVVVTLITIYKI
ncbi:ECF transporter S component [Mesoplasma seiffertii]|uniref:ECF transporter S component n=1 Tax=Mesoplasma seiffertii TaxID=28224 RepID=UPI00055F31ED|nr:ECF transporter S component [Mesoplasma seiffertii]